ncbi:uncharacterized protein DS421_13g417200 [Arachis hypogaea]|nr:uncharacterized protein DS421_13g417200 [Arachis hypogaea]
MSLAAQKHLNQADLQNMAIIPGDYDNDAARSGDVSRVVTLSTPPNSKETTISAIDCEAMIAHTLVKWICLRIDCGGSSHTPSTASKNLLPAFEKYMTKDTNDPRATNL